MTGHVIIRGLAVNPSTSCLARTKDLIHLLAAHNYNAFQFGGKPSKLPLPPCPRNKLVWSLGRT